MHPRNLGALALAAVLTLSACSSDDPEPKVAPTPSAATSSVATSPSTEPTNPQAELPNSPAGARAFVRRWVDLVNEAQASGQTTQLEAASDERCTACSGILKEIRRIYDGGGRIDGGDWRVGKIRELPKDYGADWGGFAEARTTAQTVNPGEGEPTSFQAGRFDLYAYPAWTGENWIMRWLRTPY